MTARLARIVRHPLKSIGREDLRDAELAPGEWLPGDRVWAIAHANASLDGGWAAKRNFLRGVVAPSLMAATARLSADGEHLHLDHPEAGEITVAPDDPADWPALREWLGAMWPTEFPAPDRVYRSTAAHLSDVPDPWISVHSTASHRAVEDRIGRTLSRDRWRGNLWIDGLAPWEEFGWIGRTVRIGGAVLRVTERIGRCKATMANPETGRRDADTLAALETWGHDDFGVYAEVVEGGPIAIGDPVAVPP